MGGFTMTKNGMLCLATTSLIALGCSMQQADRAAPPTGPVQTASAERDLIPAGTNLVIRTNEAIQTQQAGQTFSAELGEDVQNQTGDVLAPKGSPAELIVSQVTSGGTVGTSELQLALRSITINGKKYSISTETSAQRGEEGLGQNRRTAEMVGGGAALGTLLGAIAGGAKGAVIGAIGGAAGGAAVQVLTRGKEVSVPAETLLTFRTESPLRLVG
jgi:hypothetical protein